MGIFLRKCSMATVLAFLSCVLCAGSAHAAPTDLSTIKAAVPLNFPPQYSTDSSGNPQGFAIDVINHVAALAHCSIEFHTYENWDAAHNALQSGDVDIIPNMGITARREEYALFTDPVETFPIRIFVRDENSHIQSEEDLAGHAVAVVQANVGYELLKDRTDLQLVIFNDWEDGLFQLLSGHVDAMVYPQPVLVLGARNAHVDNRIKAVGLPLKEIKRAVAVRKSNTNLFHSLQTAVKAFTGTKEYQEIYQKWYGRPRPFLTPMRMWMILFLSVVVILAVAWFWQYHAQKRFSKALLEEIDEQTEYIKCSEKKYHQLVDTMFEGIIRAGTHGKIILANQASADIFGYDGPEEMIGLNMTDFYANPDQRNPFIRALQNSGRIHNLQFHFIRKDGSTGLALCNVKWFYNEDETIAGTEGLIRDITELTQMEHKLALAQKLESVGQLAAGIAHEINTPMQYILSNLAYLDDSFTHVNELIQSLTAALQHAGNNQPFDEHAARITELESAENTVELMQEIAAAIADSINGTERITEIVKAMKYFSHPGSDEMNAVQLNEAIKTTITIARNEWKYSANVETQLDPSLPTIMGYAGDINQVLLNLLVNAAHAVNAKYQREGIRGLITISSHSSSQGVEISITDSGDGIPEAYQHQIFDPFFTTKEVGKGTGQGLAISHCIIEKHNGSIDFTTEPGHGTTFTIRLPHNGE